MSTIKRFRKVLVLISLGCFALLLSFSVHAADQPPIKIGVTMPLSGPTAFGGKIELNGMNLAIKKIHAEGGILGGRKIEIIVYDDKSNPEEAVSAIKKLIAQDKVAACVTGLISTPALAQKEVTREAKMIHMIVTAQHPKITSEGHPYLFRLNTTTAMGANALCNYVIEKLKPKTAWYLGVNDDFGRTLAGQYESNFAKAGIKFLGSEYYRTSDPDFMIYLTKGKNLKPDIFMMAAPSEPIASTIMKQRKQLQFAGMMTQCPGVLNQIILNLAGDASEGVYCADSWVRTLNTPENRWFIEAYEREYKGSSAGKMEAAGFEAMLFLLQAMDKAGSVTDADKIAHVLRTTTFYGPRGKITFDKTGQGMATDYPLVVKNRQIVIAE